MKRIIAIALAAFVAVSAYAVAAPAGQQAVTPKQFTALSKRVKKLENDDKILVAFAGLLATCLDQGAVATTKAPQFHAPATGEPTDFYVFTTTNADCVNIINSPAMKKVLKLRSH
jgi:hypothetical protein